MWDIWIQLGTKKGGEYQNQSWGRYHSGLQWPALQRILAAFSTKDFNSSWGSHTLRAAFTSDVPLVFILFVLRTLLALATEMVNQQPLLFWPPGERERHCCAPTSIRSHCCATQGYSHPKPCMPQTPEPQTPFAYPHSRPQLCCRSMHVHVSYSKVISTTS